MEEDSEAPGGSACLPFFSDTSTRILSLGLVLLAGAPGLSRTKGPQSLVMQVLELRERHSGGDRWLPREWGAVRRVLTVRVSSPFLAC